MGVSALDKHGFGNALEVCSLAGRHIVSGDPGVDHSG